MSIRLYGLLAWLCLAFSNPLAAHAADSIPLERGDRVPASIWNYIHQQQVGAKKSKPSPGKWTILQLMQTTCGSCVNAMPRLQQLQQAHADSLQVYIVSPQSQNLMQEFAARQQAKGIYLPMLAGDRWLQKLFPHKIISHVVWIDPAGKVRAITSTDSFYETAWQQAANGNIDTWVVKRDLFNFDRAEPLLKPNPAQEEAMGTIPVWHTAMSGYLPGVAPAFGSFKDSSTGTIRSYFINYMPSVMYKMLMGTFLFFPEKCILWELPNRAQLERPTSETQKDGWSIQYACCFEAVFPISIPKEQRLHMMVKMLNQYLGIGVRMELRDTVVLRLEKLDTSLPIKTNVLAKACDQQQYYTGPNIRLLAGFFNYSDSSLPMVVSGLPPKQALDWCLPRAAKGKLNALNRALAVYNLCLRPARDSVKYMVFGTPAKAVW
ncbi:MAG TPA: redoxin domain-containing protein [Phnomibacter sp.]|nr:redoxin domain-containing protein [Phnomibacter sp.]